jgi:hypothetical protein
VNGKTIVTRPLKLGYGDDRMFIVREGVQAGDTVLIP